MFHPMLQCCYSRSDNFDFTARVVSADSVVSIPWYQQYEETDVNPEFGFMEATLRGYLQMTTLQKLLTRVKYNFIYNNS